MKAVIIRFFGAYNADMKKFVLLLILPIIFCSCSAGRVTASELLSHQQSDLSCVYYAGNFTAEIEVEHAEGEILVTYVQPENLSGLTFSVGEKEVSIVLGDNRYPISAETGGHLFKIYRLVNLEEDGYKKLETSNGGISYEALFECDMGDVILSYDMRERRTTLITADNFELEICSLGITEENEITESVQ